MNELAYNMNGGPKIDNGPVWPHAYAILSLDNGGDARVVQTFRAVMNALELKCKPLVGRWNGETEQSWLVPSEAVQALEAAQLISQQEAILFVSSCNKMYATMWYTEQRVFEAMGSMCAVSADEASEHAGYTYDPATNVYYVCKDENPDKVPPDAGWPSTKRTAQIQNYMTAVMMARPNAQTELHLAHLNSLYSFLRDYFGVKL